MLADQEEWLGDVVAAEMELRVDAEFEDRHFIEISARDGLGKEIGAILTAHVSFLPAGPLPRVMPS
jgi:hypothetical protein